MELLDRYIIAIGKQLPRKNRADIQSEIRSILQDMLEDRSRKTGRPVDEALTSELLREYGSPEKVAAAYLSERYLIGPKLYPFFLLVLKIVFAVITSLALVGLGIGIANSALTADVILRILGRAGLQYLGAAVAAIGNIVIVFAILERVLPGAEFDTKDGTEKEWDPSKLEQEPDTDRVRMGEAVATIVFTFAALLIFNFYPQIIAYTPSLNNLGSGEVVFFSLLSEAFFRYLPWLNVLWVLEIGLYLILLRQGKWSLVARFIRVGLALLSIGVLAAMLVGPSLLTLTPETLQSWKVEPPAAETLFTLLNVLMRVGLAAAIIATGVDIIKHIYRMIVKPQHFKQVAAH
jgi:hypothetical protein